jgi:hypothetical protein
MAMLDFILGRHLASDEDKDERVGPLAGVSVFGLDALSSAAFVSRQVTRHNSLCPGE